MFVKWRGNTKSKVTVEDFEKVKEAFLLEAKNAVLMDENFTWVITKFDQMWINYVPVSSWSMEEEGAKR